MPSGAQQPRHLLQVNDVDVHAAEIQADVRAVDLKQTFPLGAQSRLQFGDLFAQSIKPAGDRDSRRHLVGQGRTVDRGVDAANRSGQQVGKEKLEAWLLVANDWSDRGR